MKTGKILLRSWIVLSSALTIALLIGLIYPVARNMRLKREKADIEILGSYQEGASVQRAISLGQATDIKGKRGVCGLANIRDIDAQYYISEYKGGNAPYVSLLWFYHFTPLKMRRTGYYLEVLGAPNTNDTFYYLLAPYEELIDVRILQTIEYNFSAEPI